MKELNLSQFPAASGLRQWIQTMYESVCTASKRSKRRTLRWIQAVETAPSLEYLERLAVKQKRWDDLDTALASAIDNAAGAGLKRALLIYKEEWTWRVPQAIQFSPPHKGFV